jgi:hypothetical protein
VLRYLDAGRARELVTSATLVEQVQLDRFRQQADPDHAARVAASLGDPSANATRALTDGIATGVPAGPVEAALSTALISAEGRASLQSYLLRDVAGAATRRAATARQTAVGIGCLATGLVILVVGLGTAVSRSVTRPLRRISLAASTAADVAARELVRVTNTESADERPPRLIAVTIQPRPVAGRVARKRHRILPAAFYSGRLSGPASRPP